MANALGVPSPDKVEYMADAAELGRDYKHQLLVSLGLRPGDTVLDVGCGPGMDLPVMADAVTTSGRVIGVDVDPAMVAAARSLLDYYPQVDVRQGDAHALPVDDGTADRARMDRALQHVENPSGVLAELHRVLKPGGLLRIAEPDWDALIVDGDLEMNRAFNRFVCSAIVRNATIGRRLGRLAREAGFEVEDVRAATTVLRDFARADYTLALTRNTERAIRAGAIERADGERWLAELRAGGFQASVTIFLLSARKPL
ncbi:methyltransferase domain-containing protein [Lentzea californiensis]|uniref:methyltransferase domain-containing protein n=1 Tax=Lentzea californiensis TaxID=438851 RepID=UPI00216497E3|nr:methyltransferase domain-containing protein [Lentzea californiensis]MCR3746469.1 Methyltransferase domain-containing protein [Lentzea californiensis]